jgi:hypothetical protein
MNYLDLLRKQFNSQVAFKERRPGIQQLIAPLYHEDGDMVDIFLQPVEGAGKVRVFDYGMTLMRLSYSFDIDTPNKERIFQRILSENGIQDENGNLFIEAEPESLYPAILQFAQTVGKVSNMQLYKREVIQSLFYEMLEEFVMTQLAQYHPRKTVYPIPQRDDLEVDYQFELESRPPIYLFGVKDDTKARLASISCLEFQRANLPFKSVAIHEDFDHLTRKDRGRITSALDKQFVSLEDFQINGEQYLRREAA